MVRKNKSILYYIVKSDGIKVLLALIVFLISVSVTEGSAKDYIDLKYFTSIVLAAVFLFIVNNIQKIVLNLLEDSQKLTEDYEKLMCGFDLDYFCYDGVKFPIVDLTSGRRIKDIVFKDSIKSFQLDDLIKRNYDVLLKASETSDTLNSLKPRLKDYNFGRNGVLKLFTERTTNLDTIITNRTLDYKLPSGLTIRDCYIYEPFFPSLNESTFLSNSFGFDVYIESCDGYVALEKRDKHQIVGKNIYGASLSMSLNLSKCVNNDKLLDKNKVLEYIRNIIAATFGIDDEVKNISYRNVISLYRDIVEGGRPKLYMHYKALKTKSELMDRLVDVQKSEFSNKRINKNASIKWIDIRNDDSLKITNYGIYQKGIFYKSTPPLTAGVAMIKKHIND